MAWKSPYFQGNNSPYFRDPPQKPQRSRQTPIIIQINRERQIRRKKSKTQKKTPILTKKQKKWVTQKAKKGAKTLGGFLKKKLKEKLKERKYGKKIYETK